MHYALNGENETALWEVPYKTGLTVITVRRGLDIIFSIVLRQFNKIVNFFIV
jgi:hypothetical protein